MEKNLLYFTQQHFDFFKNNTFLIQNYSVKLFHKIGNDYHNLKNSWIFIDWILPKLSGLELCRQIRNEETLHDIHITMILENDNPNDCRRAIQAGADDYMIGPLSSDVLFERLNKSIRFQKNASNYSKTEVRAGIEIDSSNFRVNYLGQNVHLSPNEFRLLNYFLRNPDRIHSRQSIIQALGKDDHRIDERTVDVWIRRLRHSLSEKGVPNPLRTVRSMGYVFDNAQM